jgi:hypothetical protein
MSSTGSSALPNGRPTTRERSALDATMVARKSSSRLCRSARTSPTGSPSGHRRLVSRVSAGRARMHPVCGSGGGETGTGTLRTSSVPTRKKDRAFPPSPLVPYRIW